MVLLMANKMKKYKVVVYTTCPDFQPECTMDDESLEWFKEMITDLDDGAVFVVEDDTKGCEFHIRASALVGVEIHELA